MRVQLPGIKADGLDIQVGRKSVSLSGEHRHEDKAEKDGMVRSEFRYGQFHRVIPLPVAVENQQVQADYTNGVLTLTLPKVIEARNTIVKVNLAKAVEENAPAPEPETASGRDEAQARG